jgi:hypothetical protein
MVSAIRGSPKDDLLISNEVRRQRRLAMMTIGAGTGMLLASAILGMEASEQKVRANRSLDLATEAVSDAMTDITNKYGAEFSISNPSAPVFHDILDRLKFLEAVLRAARSSDN